MRLFCNLLTYNSKDSFSYQEDVNVCFKTFFIDVFFNHFRSRYFSNKIFIKHFFIALYFLILSILVIVF